MAKNKKGKNIDSVVSFRGRRFKSGSYNAAMLVFVVAIVIVLNLVVSKLPEKCTSIDVSGVDMYSISDQTKKILDRLDTDVELYYLVNTTMEETYGELSKLITNYESASDHIKVYRRDPELYPTFGDQYEATSTTALIVKSDKRYRLLDFNDIFTISNYEDVYYYGEAAQYDFNGDNLLANAINYVTTDSLPKVYELEGNGELALDSTVESGITDSNITVESLNLLKNSEVPEDCDCLMILSPEKDLSETEAKAIISYLKKGGNAIICSDYLGDTKMPNFMSVMEAYGVTVEDGMVFEGDTNYTYNNTPTYIFPNLVSLEFTTDLVSSKSTVFMPSSQSIQTLEDKADTIEVMSLLTSSDASYLKDASSQSENYEKKDGDKEGPFDVAVAITDSNISEEEAEESGEEQEVKTKLAVFGSSAIMDSSIYSQVTPYNVALFVNTLGWMCDSQDSISIDAKKMNSDALLVTDSDANKWLIVYAVCIPVLVLVTGAVVSIRRSKK